MCELSKVTCVVGAVEVLGAGSWMRFISCVNMRRLLSTCEGTGR